jgi:hypothetical protein
MAKTLEEFEAWLDEMDGIKPQKPKAVVEEGEVVRDADPHVSVEDPNYPGSEEGLVKVRRPDWVTVRMDLWEEQQRWKMEQRRLRRMLDPCRLGLWGPTDDDAA